MKNFTISLFSLILVCLLAILVLPQESLAQNSITVQKVTAPTGQGPFAFTSNTAPANFSLNGGQSQVFNDLAAGMYVINEIVQIGSDLVITSNDNTCAGTTVVADNMAGTATITLADTCDLVVTFTNTGNSTVTILKNTIPNNNVQQFDFTSTLPGQNNFTITSASGLIVQNVLGGTYTVQENITPGYTLTNISCNDLDTSTNLANRTATINVSENENIICIFTNTANGEIIIRKNTVPPGGIDFSFDEDITALNGSFMLDDGGSITFLDVSPGTYTVTEDDPMVTPGGFILSDIVCDDMGSSTNVGTRTATIDLDAEEVITCTFTNTAQLEGLTILKTDIPDPVSAGEELSYVIDILNGSNFVATNVTLVDMLPDGLTGVDVASNIQGVDCQFDNIINPQMVTCDIPDLTLQQTVQITIAVIPNPNVFDGDPVIIENTAILTADPGNVMRESTTQTLVTPQVDIGIDGGNENRRVGEGSRFSITYDITVNPDNQQALADLNSEDARVRADALDVMLDVGFPDDFQVESVETSQGMCTIGSVNCNLGNILEGQTVSVTIVFIAPNVRGDFLIEAVVTVLGGQSFTDLIFVFVRENGDSNCSLAPAGSTGKSNLLYLFIPLFILARRYWKGVKTKA